MGVDRPSAGDGRARDQLAAQGLHPLAQAEQPAARQNEYVYRALRAGASGFLLKDAPSSRLVAAVRAAATGDSLIEPSITRRLVERFAQPEPEPTDAIPAELAQLTERERDVLRLIASGQSNAEIAATMVVAETTADSQRRR